MVKNLDVPDRLKQEWDDCTGNLNPEHKQPENPVDVCNTCGLAIYVHLSRCPRCGTCIGCN